jgi:hypothetical protein
MGEGDLPLTSRKGDFPLGEFLTLAEEATLLLTGEGDLPLTSRKGDFPTVDLVTLLVGCEVVATLFGTAFFLVILTVLAFGLGDATAFRRVTGGVKDLLLAGIFFFVEGVKDFFFSTIIN